MTSIGNYEQEQDKEGDMEREKGIINFLGYASFMNDPLSKAGKIYLNFKCKN